MMKAIPSETAAAFRKGIRPYGDHTKRVADLIASAGPGGLHQDDFDRGLTWIDWANCGCVFSGVGFIIDHWLELLQYMIGAGLVLPTGKAPNIRYLLAEPK
jgi:hypothetical protein